MPDAKQIALALSNLSVKAGMANSKLGKFLELSKKNGLLYSLRRGYTWLTIETMLRTPLRTFVIRRFRNFHSISEFCIGLHLEFANL